MKEIQSPIFPTQTYTFSHPTLTNLLFFDIETTGLSPKSAILYLIGCTRWENNAWTLTQWIAQAPDEESQVISSFLSLIKEDTILVHYNGIGFDLPFLKHRAEQLGIPHSLDSVTQLDLYRTFLPFQSLFGAPNCKLKTIEPLFSFYRTDTCTGKELITTYKRYLTLHHQEDLEQILLHNRDDLQGLLEVSSLLGYQDLLKGNFQITKILRDESAEQVFVTCKTEIPLRPELQFSSHSYFFSCKNRECQIKIPLSNNTTLFYYSNYMDYYYLPEEDTAIHKSVASYVDKNYRKPATKETCYTKIQLDSDLDASPAQLKPLILSILEHFFS